MSFILDALRKSEHARQHLGGATLAELPLGRRTRSQPWWVIALAILLLVNLVVLSVLLFRKEPQKSAGLPVAAPAAPAAVAAPTPQSPRSAAPANRTPPPSLADEVVTPNVAIETIPREESPLASNSPDDGPRLVKPIEQPQTRSLPLASAASGLPELRIDMHVYSTIPKDRFVYINMRKYVEGQSLAEGPKLDKITPEGAILWYQGQEWTLPR